MAGARQIFPQNRLALFVNTADGIPLAEALARADANIATLRPPGVSHLDAMLSELAGRAAEAPSHHVVEQLYWQANELAGVAASFGLPSLGRAAHSLCELLDRLGDGGWNAAAVQVHLEALRLLRGEDQGAISTEAVAAVLKGLDRVVNRLVKRVAKPTRKAQAETSS